MHTDAHLLHLIITRSLRGLGRLGIPQLPGVAAPVVAIARAASPGPAQEWGMGVRPLVYERAAQVAHNLLPHARRDLLFCAVPASSLLSWP